VLFHALNGVRVILVDFWAKGPRYQKQMLWGILGLLVVLMVPSIGRMFYLLLTEH
jgi:succinate dehydrogenase / fumarate reductase, cytochrome b subunit